MSTIIDLPKRPSQQMRAVLKIVRADYALEKLVMPHIDLKNEGINWDKILTLRMDSSQRTLIDVAYGIWRDEPRPQSNFFEGALNWDLNLKWAVLEALSIRWGISDMAKAQRENCLAMH